MKTLKRTFRWTCFMTAVTLAFPFPQLCADIPANGPTVEPHPEVLKLQTSFENIADMVKPAVVSISTTHVEKVPEMPQFFFGDPFEQFFQQFFGNPEEGAPMPRRQRPQTHEFKLEGMGSGVIIDPSGLVLTNEHVVRDADQIKVTVYDSDGNKKNYTGTVVGKDARTDVAVVRIHAGHKLPYAALGDSSSVRVGQWAIAIGSPFGLAQTMTVGVISAARQSLPIEGREYRNLIQTDAAINRGNSGGPLLNIRGEVIGINTAIYAPTGVFAGIGFAIPINQAKDIMQELLKKGHVTRGWLGIELAREITPAMVKNFGLPDNKGALVNEVMKNSPAEKSGLKRGDVIRSFDGKPVATSDVLQNAVTQTAPSKTIPVEIFRDKHPMKLNIVLGERPESADTGEAQEAQPQGKPSQQESWQGAKIQAFTPDMAEHFEQPAELKGVIVVDVDAGSVAEDMGIAPGDVIRSINQVPTPTPEAFKDAAEKANAKEGVVLDIVRQGHPIYLSYTQGEEPNK
jgi:serine protease Do